MKKLAIKPILMAIGLLVLSLATIVILEPQAIEDAPAKVDYLPLSALVVSPTSYQPKLLLSGISKARWFNQLKAQSSGQIINFDEQLTPGSLVSKQQLLLKVDPIHLQAELSAALSQIKLAELNYQREKHEQTVALSMLSNTASSAFARREPQLAAAKAELAQARSSYQSIQQRLRDSQVDAPFNAIIINSYVSPKQQLDVGDPLFDIASSESIDITLPVSELHWSRIQASLAEPQITVIDRQNKTWPASVRYIAPQVDATTRQRQVVLSVAKPYQSKPRLLPEQQVNIQVSLSVQSTVAKLPMSALTKDGEVWTIDSKQQLQLEQVTILDENESTVWLKFVNQPEQTRNVVVYPLPSLLPGLRVKPSFVQESQL
ncbi:efflux RND transporter periplasmic adaptor subunit [Agarivorans sp. B2Z047]|uniref:efflux RND transporter periplasmic adaptor subunit n=1 Tax=Agarivorans sp. B2Z047 TaxID=2652721 RepID=UPI00128E3D87|nr:efflux RND transporter periplasmic adaptor subunit [Agarivorans sp. B2Z047]MPW29266.1 efflux RND transporter periplasmic adaptor subunit [Agarivorans sp. B2Z047]UQN41819.1 efflux RND transporter periplasmic adaptor subunit [Agarivorans sp. B2Z047]